MDRLPVFSSDAISSTTYATEEILFVTALGASSLALGLSTLVPIAIAVAILSAIVTYLYIVSLGGMLAIGLFRSYFGDIRPVPFDSGRFEGARQVGGTPGTVSPVPRFLVGSRGPQRRRGDLEWCPCVPQAGGEGTQRRRCCGWR